MTQLGNMGAFSTLVKLLTVCCLDHYFDKFFRNLVVQTVARANFKVNFEAESVDNTMSCLIGVNQGDMLFLFFW